ncbi:hypothetical protein COO91_00852 [Nostoc flagelliforme CCNUN1]|uniref:Uncharacterized protein n=1 Tax=Nostoc flagelliforme CCNUN1 TaxID=2038116 RepID=A0A2K8SHS0_9NOSO|nr:hypothetical protein [Nostoc flagelliforme]AUB35004.1 hypothetical protein COO91_00852 [Nostoc flagelliforme CCNUN1]
MAAIKISDLHSTLLSSISSEEEFIGSVDKAIIRAIDARQLQNTRGGLNIKGGLNSSIPTKVLVGFIAV